MANLPNIRNAHDPETRNIINLAIDTINNRGIEILSDEAFLTWLYENGIKHREEVQSFSDLPDSDSLNTIRGVAEDNKIYILKEGGWLPFQTIDVQKINHVETYVKRKEVDIWDFAHLVPNSIMMPNPDDWDWTDAVQAAIDLVTGSYIYNQLRFPAGKYKVSDTVGLSEDGDIDVGLHIIGSGRTATTGRATTIEMTDNTKPLFNILNSKSNIRGVVIENIQLYAGSIGLNLQNSTYNYFRNVSFSRQREVCIKSHVGSLNFFDSCYFVHAPASALNFSGAGTDYFSNCTFGEDIGSIHVSVRKLIFSNCSFTDIRNKQEPEGTYGLGNNVFGIDGGGQIKVNNSNIRTNREVAQVLVTANNQRNCEFNNCDIQLQNQTLLVSRYQTGTYIGSHFNFVDCNIKWDDDAVLFKNGVGEGSSPIRNSVLSGNTFTIPKGATITTENWFVNHIFNNSLGNNKIVEV